ncbi:MAG: UDP-N-acetylmuramoyl-L-alanine--D-glutamate ligase [Verrucomicrobia bacterium]|nr:UDP-N-acetylmuramoyl-L-alanine--D-glutamate ligase [Verrucomicrobiota bacterium]NBU07871.1 UDP-N-acetylmuramoyl-L-alanine--D-glutamate ligase [Pseudomonadota bacterium]NDA68444.1 UDP-N-acetylmuramoyl-L-alanine--D-glutamate ligase [Verrucomicrobiota bacterium]NDB76922.1 UDP-N-acetylmuramoyl-L-alanine--D-glutamate ligase [Verrucomicrobiota bacterium]NDD40084.1 UDP-N-acetylmuramoyl-L-alanine--D-glutamate ligase [Verrucomicrobiota bacterium]
MFRLQDKNVLVIGLGLSGAAAARLLVARGARVAAMDNSDTPVLRREAEELRDLGVRVELDLRLPPAGQFDFAVVSPGVALDSLLVKELRQREIPVIGELELGWQQAVCLNVAVTGTNGKTTTTELIEHVLTHCHKRTLAAGNIGKPLCSVVDESKQLDYLTLEVSSFQLETIRFFRPAVAVLLNITPDHLDRHHTMAEYARAKARMFENQQPFDWAVVQTEALAQLRTLGVKVPSKLITFSAQNRRADIHLDRSLIISRIEDWVGPLIDLEKTNLRGPHNAENVMATLAVGRVLRLPLEQMVEAITSFRPGAHRCELIAEINGIKFVNDSKATNVDAVAKALQTMPAAQPGEANVLLIAGGRDKGLDYHDLGPLLAQRVKHAFLLGETREKLRASWSLFTPCTLADSLLEAVNDAARNAALGDIVLLSPACSSFDLFRDYRHRGEVFRQAVEQLERTSNGGVAPGNPTNGGVPKNDLVPTSR